MERETFSLRQRTSLLPSDVVGFSRIHTAKEYACRYFHTFGRAKTRLNYSFTRRCRVSQMCVHSCAHAADLMAPSQTSIQMTNISLHAHTVGPTVPRVCAECNVWQAVVDADTRFIWQELRSFTWASCHCCQTLSQQGKNSFPRQACFTHTHTHIHIYIYTLHRRAHVNKSLSLVLM